PCALEHKAQSELPVTRRAGAGAVDDAEVTGAMRGAGVVELGRVPHVERLGAELHLVALRERDVLEQREVPVVDGRSDVREVAQGAERARRRPGDRAGVEELRGRASAGRRIVRIPAGNQVRTDRAAGADALVAGDVEVVARLERD